MASGLGIEAEEMGMVALMAALLLPGLVWMSKAKTVSAILERSIVVGIVLAGAVILEGTMDSTMNVLSD